MTYAQFLRRHWELNVPREDRIQLFKLFWRLGDPSPIAEWLGIEYIPPSLREGLDLDDELRLTIEHARRWIANVYRRLYEPVPV